MKFMKQKGLSRLWSRQNCAYVMWNSFETDVKKRSLRYIWKYNFSRKLIRLIDHLKCNKLQTPTSYFLTAFINNPKLWNKWAKIIGLEKLLKQIWKVSLKFRTIFVHYSSQPYFNSKYMKLTISILTDNLWLVGFIDHFWKFNYQW